MKTSVNNNQREFGAICRVANQILKERKCTRKEAYAIAKAQLENKSGMTRQKFEAMLKAQGVPVSDEMRMAPNGQRPIQFPGLISRLAAGTTYTDAELLGLLAGIELTH